MQEQQLLLTDLMEMFGKQIWIYCYSVVRSKDVADDLVQDVFIRVYENVGKFRNASSVRTWIFTIARNRCKDYFRSAFTRRVTLTDKVQEEATSESAEDEVLKRIQHSTLLNSLFRLKPAYREVVLLHVREELTFREIAEIVGVREGTIRSRYRRAIQQIRTYFDGEVVSDGT